MSAGSVSANGRHARTGRASAAGWVVGSDALTAVSPSAGQLPAISADHFSCATAKFGTQNLKFCL